MRACTEGVVVHDVQNHTPTLLVQCHHHLTKLEDPAQQDITAYSVSAMAYSISAMPRQNDVAPGA